MSDNGATLHHWTLANATLEAALQSVAAPLAGATALLYAPWWCLLGVVLGTGVAGADGELIDMSGVFEARIFNDAGELRWWNDPGAGVGRAVWLTEISSQAPLPTMTSTWTGPLTREVERRENRYLLWGKPHRGGSVPPLTKGWTRMSESRVTEIDIPADVNEGQRGTIETFEYLGRAPGEAGETHGNVVVVEERLTRIGALNTGVR